MNLVEHFAEEKKNEGRAEGEAAGRRGLLLKLLAVKFGASSSQTEDRIANATLEDVDRWAERILTAESLEDVFAT